MSKETDTNTLKEVIETIHPINWDKVKKVYTKWISDMHIIPNYVLTIAFFIFLLLIIFSSTYQRWWFAGMLIVVGMFGKREGHWEGYMAGYEDGRDEGIDLGMGKDE